MSAAPPRPVRRRCPESLLPVLRRLADDTAQEIRHGLLRGAHVLIVLAGYPGEEVKAAYFRRAHELGVEVVVLNHEADQVKGLWELRDQGVIAQVIPFDPADTEAARQTMLDSVRSAGRAPDGVVTFVEFGLTSAAWLAQVLGLPGNDFEVVRGGRDKELTRTRSETCGVPAPRYRRIRDERDLPAAGAHVRFPAILKPVAGLTSIEVHHVRTEAELAARYRETRDRMERNDHPNPAQLLAVTQGGFDMILEEYLDGREYDVDLLLSDGQLVYGAVTDNFTDPVWPWLQVRANMPSELLLAEREDWLVSEAAAWTVRLGYTDGAFHVEVKTRADDTPVLLEVNARLGGASQYDLNRAAWGVDLVEEVLLNSVGIPIRPRKAAVPRKWYAARYLTAPTTGRVECADFDTVAVPAGIELLVHDAWVETGELVQGPLPGPPSWLGELTVGAADLASAQAELDRAVERLSCRLT